MVASGTLDPFIYRLIGGGTRFIDGGANGFIIIGGGIFPIGGGGGGMDVPMPRGAKSSLSSVDSKSVKSKSHNFNGRVIFRINSSQCNSFSDFFGSGFLISWSLLGDLIAFELRLFNEAKQYFVVNWIYRAISPLLLLFARPSLAFEINPVISPMRFCTFSSCGLIGKLLSFCVRSLTVWSRFNCSKSFFSSLSESKKIRERNGTKWLYSRLDMSKWFEWFHNIRI